MCEGTYRHCSTHSPSSQRAGIHKWELPLESLLKISLGTLMPSRLHAAAIRKQQ